MVDANIFARLLTCPPDNYYYCRPPEYFVFQVNGVFSVILLSRRFHRPKRFLKNVGIF